MKTDRPRFSMPDDLNNKPQQSEGDGGVASPEEVELSSLVDVNALVTHCKHLSVHIGGTASIFPHDKSGPRELVPGRCMTWRCSPLCIRLTQNESECTDLHWKSAIAAMESGRPTEGSCRCGQGALLSCPVMLTHDGVAYPKACLTFALLSPDSLPSPRQLSSEYGLSGQEGRDLLDSTARLLRTPDRLPALRASLLATAQRISREISVAYACLLAESRVRDARESLSESEEKYRNLVEASPVGVCLVQGDAYVYVNDAFARMFGYTAAEIAADKKLTDLVAPDSRRAVTDSILRRYSGELAEAHYTATGLRKDGRVFDMEAHGRAITYRGRPAIIGTVIDITDRKRAEDALRESEARYRLLADNASDVIWALDMNLRFTYVSPSVERLRGYTVEEAMSQSVDEIFTPRSLEAIRKALDEELASEEARQSDPRRSRTLELEMIRKGGSTFWAEVTASFLRDGKGLPIGIVGVTRDISERKTAEDALREAEEKYRSLAEESLVGVYIVQGDRFVYVNPRFARMLGYTRSELIHGKHLLDLSAPDSRSVISGSLQKRYAGGAEGIHHTAKYVRKDGALIDVEAYGSGMMYRGKPAIVGTALDITDRIRAEEALRAAEEKYRLIAENATDVIWQMDLSGVMTYVSPAVRQYGYEPEEWVGRRLTEFLPPGEQETFLRRLAENRGNPSPMRYEVQMLRKDGSLVWMEVSRELVTKDGSPSHLQGIARDMTERKAADDVLRAAEERYRLLAENTTDIIWQMDLDGVLTYASPAVRQYGYEPEEWVGESGAKFLPLEDRETIQRELAENSRDPSPMRRELQMLCKDGSLVWLDVSRELVTKDGSPLHLQGVARDITERKKAEESLRSEYAFRRTVEDAVPVGVVAARLDGTIVHVNRAYCEMLGWREDELVGQKPPYKHWPPEDRRTLQKGFEQGVAAVYDPPPNVEPGEARLMRKDGRRISVLINGSPLHDSAGKPYGWVCSVVDITERKRAEDALRAEQAFRSAIEDSVSTGIVVSDMDGRQTHVNRAFSDMLGWSEEELLGEYPPYAYWPPEERDSIMSAFKGVMAGTRPTKGFDLRFLRKDGERLDVMLMSSPLSDSGGRQYGWIASVTDVTSLKRAEQAVRHSEELYRGMFASVGDGVALRERGGALIDANQAYCDMLGYSIEELRGIFVDDLFHPDSRTDAEEVRKRVTEDGECKLESVYLRKDGVPVNLDIHAVSHTHKGRPVVLSVVKDVTERARAREDLRARAERLESQYEKLKTATEQKAAFFARMSHELRTPMTSIVGFSELMLEDIEDPVSPGQRELLLKVSTNAHRLLGMVNDLLDLSRAESGRVTTTVTEVDVGRVVEQIVENMRSLARGKDLGLVAVTDGAPTIYTDEEKLSQILVNLVSNAIKFTPSGSVSVTASAGRGKARISVSDTGVGIPKADLRRIFDEFHVGDTSERRKTPGAGLGLAIVRRLCDLLGAKISVSSVVGKGSTFAVTLPVRLPEKSKE